MKALPPRQIAQVKNDDAGWMQRNLKQEARRKARRVVVPGFPWEGKFETIAEVESYMGESTIQCLLCGKHYRTLGVHLRVIHDMTCDQYHDKYGIPYRLGLAIKEVRDAVSDRAKAMIENPAHKAMLVDNLARAREGMEDRHGKSAKRAIPTVHPFKGKNGPPCPYKGKPSGYKRVVVYVPTKCQKCGAEVMRDANYKGAAKCELCQGRDKRARDMDTPEKAEAYRARQKAWQAGLRARRKALKA